MKMNPEIKKQWLEALKSGKYTHGTCRLKYDEDGITRHCCLGVLCELYPNKIWTKSDDRYDILAGESGTYWGILPSEVAEWAGINDCSPYIPDGILYEGRSTLTSINDMIGNTNYDVVIKLIEEHF